MSARHGKAAVATHELVSALALFRASRDRAHLGHVFAAFARSPRPGLLGRAYEHAARVLELLAAEAIACEELRAAIAAVDLPCIAERPGAAANDHADRAPHRFLESLDVDEPSVGDEEEALAASRAASTMPPPPDTQRSRVLVDGGATVRESDPDDAEVIDRGGRAWR